MIYDLGIKPGDQVIFRRLDKHNYVVSLLDEEKINSILLIDSICFLSAGNPNQPRNEDRAEAQ